MSTATAIAYDYRAAWHHSFGVQKGRKAQKSNGFQANGTYRACIKDNVLLDDPCGRGGFLMSTKKQRGDME